MKVCLEQFPETNGYYIDGYLKENLDIMVKHIKHDWDFVLLVSGSGKVRVGKSVMALQVGHYLTNKVNEKYKKDYKFGLDNVCLSAEELFKKSKELSDKPYSVVIYDEAAQDLMGTKILYKITQTLMDFFRECGQLNLFVIIVVPDFFDLPKTIALTRSIALIDVYYTGEFERGYFNFYNESRKKNLWLYGKKYLNYFVEKPSFFGRFTNFYPIDEQEYRIKKATALRNRVRNMGAREIRNRDLLAVCVWTIVKERWMNETELAQHISHISGQKITTSGISKIFTQFSKEMGDGMEV